MKIFDIVTEKYKTPRSLTDTSGNLNIVPITYQGQTYTPVVNNLISTQDNPEGLFKINNVKFKHKTHKYDNKNVPADYYEPSGKQQEIFSDYAIKNFYGQTGIYGWWSPSLGYFNIGIASKKDEDNNLLGRTRKHLHKVMSSTKEFTAPTGGYNIKPIAKMIGHPAATGDSEEERAASVAQRVQNPEIYKIRVVYWPIPNPGIPYDDFKGDLEIIEQDLTEKHKPVGNERTNQVGRIMDTIQITREKIQQNVESGKFTLDGKTPQGRELRILVNQIVDELGYLNSAFDSFVQNSKAGKTVREVHGQLKTIGKEISGDLRSALRSTDPESGDTILHAMDAIADMFGKLDQANRDSDVKFWNSKWRGGTTTRGERRAQITNTKP